MAALTPGTRLGIYEVIEPIGAGGMGEVYRASDTDLGRDVAIKVLPEDFAADEERLARFRREAQVLASLNHPNIAAIYGTEQNALVLELVEGPTLAERIAEGSISIDEAIAIARQIAEALEAAHEAGVIHRDLKPANVKVQEDGTVKVLDFGLAKAIEGEKEGDVSESPTLTGAATRAGVILGTAAYMSPEQAKGKNVDKRADVWAFGAVVYEMLTGRRPFAGEDVSETLAYVLTKEPDWNALPADLSTTLRSFLTRCLEKNPKRRVRDFGDMRLALDGSFETGVSESSAPEGRRVAWPALVGAVIGAALIGALVGSVVWYRGAEAPHPLARFVLDSSLERDESGVAISPDGTRIVYRSMATGNNQLVVRHLDALEAMPLDATGSRPFFSPDGNWVGYQDAIGFRKVSVRGGPSVTITGAFTARMRGASWGDDDTIVFGTNAVSGLWRVPADGGEPQALTTSDALGNHDQPQILPGGDAILFAVNSIISTNTPSENSWIAVQSLVSGETKTLVPGGTNPRYAPTGHIVYSVGTTLFAVGFDGDELELTTDPVPVLDGIVVSGFGTASFDMSNNGSLVYVAGRSESDAVGHTLVWVDREGREEALAAEPRAYTYPRISPDGTRLALDVRDQEMDIWIWEFSRETLSRLTFDPRPDFYPAWTPDGARVAFGSNRGGTVAQLFWKAADGSGAAEQLTESETLLFPQTFSRDGSRLVFRENSTSLGVNLGVLSMDGDGTVEVLLASEFNEQNAEISPDGNWLAFDSNASGQLEIYVRAFPDVDEGRWQISRGGGSQPLWGPDGRELFYLAPSGQLTSVSIETDPFAPGNPEVVLEQRYLSSAGVAQGRTYDVSPDGERFLMIKEGARGEETDPTQLILVQNWFDELKRLVPVDN